MMLMEIVVGSFLDHPNIVNMHGARHSDTAIYLIMDQAAGLPLRAIIQKYHLFKCHASFKTENPAGRLMHPPVLAHVMKQLRGFYTTLIDVGIARFYGDFNATTFLHTISGLCQPGHGNNPKVVADAIATSSEQYAELDKIIHGSAPMTPIWTWGYAPPEVLRAEC
eukprot:gene49655-50583_t